MTLRRAVLLAVATSALGTGCDGGSSGSAGVDASGWVELQPEDSSVFEHRIEAIAAVLDWRDRLLVIAASAGATDVWTTGNGRDWERQPFEPPSGCDPWGGVTEVRGSLAVSCREPEGPSISVAVSDDLTSWSVHEVGTSGPSFGTGIGPAPGGGLAVVTLESEDINTTEGATLRVWTSDGEDLDTWTEVPGEQPETLVDGFSARIRTIGDYLVIVGARNENVEPSGLVKPRPAIWTSRDGQPFTVTLLPPSSTGSALGQAFDVVDLGSTRVVVGGSEDGRRGMAWTTPNLRDWTASSIDPTSGSTTETFSALWSVAVTTDGTALATDVEGGDGSVPSWSSTDGQTWESAGEGPDLVARWGNVVVGARAGDRLRVYQWQP